MTKTTTRGLPSFKWHQLHWVLCGDVKHDVGQKLISCATKPFSVHKLIKVARKLVLMVAMHPLELDFNTIPVGFHILGVDPSGSIHKLDRMVDYSMVGRLATLLYAAHSSDHTVEPFATCCCMIGIRVAASLWGTICM